MIAKKYLGLCILQYLEVEYFIFPVHVEQFKTENIIKSRVSQKTRTTTVE